MDSPFEDFPDSTAAQESTPPHPPKSGRTIRREGLAERLDRELRRFGDDIERVDSAPPDAANDDNTLASAR